MYRFASQPLPEPTGGEYAVSEPTVVEADAVAARGLTGVAPQHLVQVQDAGGTAQFEATTASSAAVDAPVVVTRVFEHR